MGLSPRPRCREPPSSDGRRQLVEALSERACACPLRAQPARLQLPASRWCPWGPWVPASAERPGPRALGTSCLSEAEHLPCERGVLRVSRPSSTDLPADSSPAFLPSPPEQSPSKWYWKLVPVSGPRAHPAAIRRPFAAITCFHFKPLPPVSLSECPPWWFVALPARQGWPVADSGQSGPWCGPLSSREAFCSCHRERGLPTFLVKLNRQLRVSPLKR